MTPELRDLIPKGGINVRVLLDTNIVIHREISKTMRDDIGILFRWLDNLHYNKCIHRLTVEEINKYQDEVVRRSFNVKLESYNVLKTIAPWTGPIVEVSKHEDTNNNDLIDSRLLNEVLQGRVDILITEDKKIRRKAGLLGIGHRIFSIDGFLEKVTAENPQLADYRVLAVKKEFFGNINVEDEFFDSFRENYSSFNQWFNRKSDEMAYISRVDDAITAFLYVKLEDEAEDYSDISPVFSRKRRLKIGTFKVTLNGFKLGERFLKIVFDNAIRYHVDEIYVTIFERTIEQQRLISLLEDFGFRHHGHKEDELVLVRLMANVNNLDNPKFMYPYIPIDANNIFFVSIYHQYHTELFPDSILNTESPADFVEHTPFRNAISKVYISRAYERDLKSGDVLLFYRTGDRDPKVYSGVVTTIGIVENIVENISSEEEFISLCRKRSVFSDDQLRLHWNYRPQNRPFIVNFLYTYSLPTRPNLHRLIELGIIKDAMSIPRGFGRMSPEQLLTVLREAQANEGLIIH